MFDLEMLLYRLDAVVKAGLNARIAAINAEKNDAVVLKQVPTDAYFVQDLNGEATNFDPFVITAFEELTSDGSGPYTADEFVIGCTLVFSDSGQDVAVNKRVLRYSRALKEVFENAWSDVAASGCRIKVESRVPTLFRANEKSSDFFRAVGVSITGKLP